MPTRDFSKPKKDKEEPLLTGSSKKQKIIQLNNIKYIITVI